MKKTSFLIILALFFLGFSNNPLLAQTYGLNVPSGTDLTSTFGK